MGISIQGIKIPGVSVTLDKETGKFNVSGHYELMSDAGIVLAKQSFNTKSGYGENVVSFSPQTQKALMDTMSAMVADMNATLGLG